MCPKNTGYITKFCLTVLSVCFAYSLCAVFVFTPCALLVLCFRCGSLLCSPFLTTCRRTSWTSRAKSYETLKKWSTPSFSSPWRTFAIGTVASVIIALNFVCAWAVACWALWALRASGGARVGQRIEIKVAVRACMCVHVCVCVCA